jgi:hypothetical protein
VTETAAPAFLLVLAVLLSVMVILWGSSHLSGWSRLATRYRSDDEVQGPQWTWMSVGFGVFFWYNHCLTVTATPRGLSLRMQPLMRLFHPSLLIPWDRIAEARPWGHILQRGVALRVEPGGKLVIFTRRQYARMRGEFPARLRLE